MSKNALNKVGYFPHADTGCYWYRVKLPMDALYKAGVETVSVQWEKPVPFEEITSYLMYGIQGMSVIQVPQFIQRHRKKFVFDIDDAFEFIDEFNPYYHAIKSDAFTAMELLETADTVTTTTPELKAHLEKLTKAEVKVVPNCYEPSQWEERPHKSKKLRIGFAGGMSHIADLNLILPVIAKLQKKYDFEFVIAGLGDADYTKWFESVQRRLTPMAQFELITMDKLLKDISYEWYKFGHWTKHPATLSLLDLDIGLCPLKDTPFNRCKSPIKAMEYSLVGTCAISTMIPPFTEEPTSVRTENHNWEKSLVTLIESPSLRESVISESKEWLKANRDVNLPQHIELLKEIFEIK